MEISSQLSPLDLCVISAYLFTLLLIGVIVSYRRRDQDDQFLAGRSFGWCNVGLSVFGTNINPSFLIASASAAYTTGMVTANFEWLAWPFLLLLAMLFAPYYVSTQVSTMPQFIHKRFGPGAAEFLSWYALVSTTVLWLGGALYAGGLLLGQILNWPLWASVTALMGVAAFLTIAGGLAVVIVTDSFQSILMIVGATTMTVIGFAHVGSIDLLLEAVPESRWALFRPMADTEYPWHAMLLGYPVLGVWFWCTDQTIVQRVLGARDLTQGQLGALFTGFLKIATPFIFVLPGFFCYVLHPNLDDPDTAFMTMVTNYLPVGMVGLIVAVLIAALVSTIDSGLNSFSTIFTLDIYRRRFKPDSTPQHLKMVGRLVTLGVALLSVGIALSMQTVEANLFDLLQSIIAYFAPPMAAVFLIGVLWRRATSVAALWTLIGGSLVSLSVGVLDFYRKPINDQFQIEIAFPHFLLMSFYLFIGIAGFMVAVSLVTKNDKCEEAFPTLTETYRREGTSAKAVWIGWIILASLMSVIYVIFN